MKDDNKDRNNNDYYNNNLKVNLKTVLVKAAAH